MAVVVLVTACGVICSGDSPAGVSVACLPQCPWGLFLTVSAPLLRIIPERVSFEQDLYTVEGRLLELISDYCGLHN
jgi:hypothetical protein